MPRTAGGCLYFLLVTASLPGCRQLLPGVAPGDEPELRVYRDTLLGLDMGYPDGWAFTGKESYSPSGKTHDLYFEPPNTLWTRRFAVKVVIPGRTPEGRDVEDFKAEFLERLRDRAAVLRLDDTSWSTLGGERAFQARYTTLLDGRPFTRNTEYLCHRGGRDVSLAFEVSDAHAGEDIVLYQRVTDRFRYHP